MQCIPTGKTRLRLLGIVILLLRLSWKEGPNSLWKAAGWHWAVSEVWFQSAFHWISHHFPVHWLIYSVCATNIHQVPPMCQALCCVLNKPSPFSLPEFCHPSRSRNISTFLIPSQMLPGHRDLSCLLCISLTAHFVWILSYSPNNSCRLLYSASPKDLSPPWRLGLLLVSAQALELTVGAQHVFDWACGQRTPAPCLSLAQCPSLMSLAAHCCSEA